MLRAADAAGFVEAMGIFENAGERPGDSGGADCRPESARWELPAELFPPRGAELGPELCLALSSAAADGLFIVVDCIPICRSSSKRVARISGGCARQTVAETEVAGIVAAEAALQAARDSGMRLRGTHQVCEAEPRGAILVQAFFPRRKKIFRFDPFVR